MVHEPTSLPIVICQQLHPTPELSKRSANPNCIHLPLGQKASHGRAMAKPAIIGWQPLQVSLDWSLLKRN